MRTMKTIITPDQAIAIAQKFSEPSDYDCDSWDGVLADGMGHVDGLAVALGIDDEYTIQY